jgi:hypothetical protein
VASGNRKNNVNEQLRRTAGRGVKHPESHFVSPGMVPPAAMLFLVSFALVFSLVTQEQSSCDFLTPEQAGELLCISTTALENHRLNRSGPRYYKIGPGRTAKILYRRQDLLAWIETIGKE